MLKTSRSTESTTWNGEGIVRISGDRRARCDENLLDRSKFDGSRIGDIKVDDEGDDKVKKKSQNLSKSKNPSKFKKIELGFFTFGARIAFTKLK